MSAPQMELKPPPKQWFWRRLGNLLGDMVLEAIGTVCAIGIIALAHNLVELWMGKDAKFFDYIPIRYVFDVGHIVVIGRLVWRIVKRFNDD
jgi:hypothetical protein